MRKVFAAAVVVVIALAFVVALTIPTPAHQCQDNKGKGKQPVCDGLPQECPPCMEWDGCHCECKKIPGCKPGNEEPPDPYPRG